MSTAPKEIAIFPLNIFLLPGECLELHIFEDRYKELVKDCLADHTLFGIVFSHKDNKRNLGSLVKLEEVIHLYPDGKMDILIRSVSIFQLEKFYAQIREKLYPGGMISSLTDTGNYMPGPLLTDEVNKYLLQYGSSEWMLDQEEGLNLFDIASELNLSDIDKLEFIQLEEPDRMEKFLKNYLRYLKLLQDQEKGVFQKFYLN